MFHFSFALFFLFGCTSGHKCIHDQLNIKPTKSFVKYDNHPFEKHVNRRRLQTYSSIRVRADFSVLQQDWSNNPTGVAQVKQAIGAVVRYLERILKVIPVSGNLLIQRRCSSVYTRSGKCAQAASQETCQSCGGSPMVIFPSSVLDSLQLYDSFLKPTTLLPKGTGLPSTDIVIYVTAKNCNCGGATLAWAGACKMDQYGRPIAGVVNICKIDTTQWDDTVDTLLHEISHILFMSSNLYKEFRDSTGTIRSNPTQVVNGRLQLQTPAVTAEARSHFGCSGLTGAPLENGGSSGSAGSHWDQQFFYTEIMCPQASGNRQAFSRFSFAALKDSGWYQINMNDADTFTFGVNAGCSFFNNPSVSANCGGFPDWYCTVAGTSCSYDGRTAGGCGGANSYNPCNVIRPYSNVLPCLTNTDTASGAGGGKTSRCAEITPSWGSPTAECYPMQCVGYNSGTQKYSSVRMTVGSQTVTCQRSEIGNTKTVSGVNGLKSLKCPNFDQFCLGPSPFQCIHGHPVGSSCFCQVGYTAADCNTKDTGSGATPRPTTRQTPRPTSGSVVTPRPTNPTPRPTNPTPRPTSSGGSGGVPSCTGLIYTLTTYFKQANPLVTKAQYLQAVRMFHPCIKISSYDSVTDIPYPNVAGYRQVVLKFLTSSAIANGETATSWRLGIESKLTAMGIQFAGASGGATPAKSTGSAQEQYPSKKTENKMTTGALVGMIIGSFIGGMLCCGFVGMCVYFGKAKKEMKGQYVLMDDTDGRTVS